VFGRLLVCMPPTKTPVFLSAVSLQTGAPKFEAPDFTELRIVTRPFPKDAGERRCHQYLLERMQASPDRPCETKAQLKKTCRPRFRVTVEGFEYCWRDAIKVAGANWDQPGRRPR
jgi:hypothetical protein